ncbi:MAG TPA: hypothetical protein VG498_09610, partial [Terriglobales bacterium]|nr:hypothetical protein [Terriglobales bacterium]
MAAKHKADDANILYPLRSSDGLDRRGFLKCMAWAGTGLLWTITAEGVPTSHIFGNGTTSKKAESGLHFAQISDSHIGFNKPA